MSEVGRMGEAISGGWIKVASIQGGWLVTCRLCGKHFTRSFMGANTNYADAMRGAEEYAQGHDQSEPHRAALSAFHAPPPKLTREEVLLGEIFGTAPPTDKERRRAAARSAALAANRERP